MILQILTSNGNHSAEANAYNVKRYLETRVISSERFHQMVRFEFHFVRIKNSFGD